MSVKLYQEELMDHFKNPRNYGTLSNPSFTSEDDNPSCGDRVQVQGEVKDGVIQSLKFEGRGCVLSQAVASMLTEKLIGKTVEYAAGVTADDIREMVGIDLGPVRIKCALLALSVLQKGLV